MAGEKATSTVAQIEAAIKEDAVGPVPDHWDVKSVAQLVADGVLSKIQDGNHGEIHPVSVDYVPSGVPFIMSGDIWHGRVDVRACKFIRPEHARSLRVGHSKKGDVLLTHKGNELGRSGILRDADYAVLTPQVTYYRVLTPQVLAPEFLRWLFESPRFQHQFKRDAAQSTRPFVSITNQLRLYLSLPPVAEQKAIAQILGTLDDKIELNRRMNATLEAMARALFQSWFVDFDPVRAKLDGRQPAGMNAATAGLFPERFDHEAEGVVPKGWKRNRWGDIATLEYGKSLRDYRDSSGKFRVFGTNGPIGFHDEALCNSAGIVIGRKGAYRGVHYSPDPFFVIDTAFYLKPKAPVDLKWAYYELLRFDINSMDSGSAIPSTSRDDFYGIPVIVPPAEIQNIFGDIVGGLFAKRFANDDQSRTLAALRDTLLLKLLTGELRVADVERVIGRAT